MGVVGVTCGQGGRVLRTSGVGAGQDVGDKREGKRRRRERSIIIIFFLILFQNP